MTKSKSSAAFTLVELLIVITIIAVLASIALPAYTGVKERADQTKDLSNAKQIALALRQFAVDNNGAYPAKASAAGGDYNAAAATAPTNSNDAFWWLFPSYLTTEQIFAVAGSAYTPGTPDNAMDDPTTSVRSKTLAAGENNFAYVLGLTDTSPSTWPLIADGFATGTDADPAYDTNKSNKGGVWSGKKAVVILCDSSGQVMKTNPSTHKVMRTKSDATQTNMFKSDTDWFSSTNTVLLPQ